MKYFPLGLWLLVILFSVCTTEGKTSNDLQAFRDELESWVLTTSASPDHGTLNSCYRKWQSFQEKTDPNDTNLVAVTVLTAELFGRKGKEKADSVYELLIPILNDSNKVNIWNGRGYYLLGNSYYRKNDFKSAYQAYQKALKILEPQNDSVYLHRLYKNLGSTNLKLDNLEMALNYYLKCLPLKHPSTHSRVYNDIAVVYLNMIRLDEAKKYLDLCLKDSLSENTLHKVLANLGRYYEIKGAYEGDMQFYDLAIETHQKALSIRQGKAKYQPFLLNSYLNLGINYIHKKEYKTAKEILETAIQFETSESPSEERYLLKKNLANVYSKLGYHIKALTFLDELIFEVESEHFLHIHSSEKYYILNELYPEKARFSQNLEKGSQNGWIVILVGLCMCLFIYLIYEKRNQARLKLEQLTTINEHDAELLKNSHQIKEKTLNRIGDELHREILGDLSSIMWQLEKNGDQHTYDQLENIYQKIREISHDLNLPYFKYGVMPALIDLVIDLNKSDKLKIDLLGSDIENIRLPEKVETSIYRIVQDALNNVIIHAKASHVAIQLLYIKEESPFISLTIEDNGKGFDVETCKRGIGLNNMEEKVKILNGDFVLNTSPGKGTNIIVTIPIESLDSC